MRHSREAQPPSLATSGRPDAERGAEADAPGEPHKRGRGADAASAQGPLCVLLLAVCTGLGGFSLGNHESSWIGLASRHGAALSAAEGGGQLDAQETDPTVLSSDPVAVSARGRESPGSPPHRCWAGLDPCNRRSVSDAIPRGGSHPKKVEDRSLTSRARSTTRTEDRAGTGD